MKLVARRDSTYTWFIEHEDHGLVAQKDNLDDAILAAQHYVRIREPVFGYRNVAFYQSPIINGPWEIYVDPI